MYEALEQVGFICVVVTLITVLAFAAGGVHDWLARGHQRSLQGC